MAGLTDSNINTILNTAGVKGPARKIAKWHLERYQGGPTAKLLRDIRNTAGSISSGRLEKIGRMAMQLSAAGESAKREGSMATDRDRDNRGTTC